MNATVGKRGKETKFQSPFINGAQHLYAKVSRNRNCSNTSTIPESTKTLLAHTDCQGHMHVKNCRWGNPLTCGHVDSVGGPVEIIHGKEFFLALTMEMGDITDAT